MIRNEIYATGEHAHIYQLAMLYLSEHFTHLPPVSISYNPEGTMNSENVRHQIVRDGLVVVWIKGKAFLDAIGLLYHDGRLEMDAVTDGQVLDLARLYGYHP